MGNDGWDLQRIISKVRCPPFSTYKTIARY